MTNAERQARLDKLRRDYEHTVRPRPECECDWCVMFATLDAALAEVDLWVDAVRCEARDCGCSTRIEGLVAALKEQG